ncbi:MAG: fatty acid hydroxylase family protein [Candidatus Scalindua sp. AMX11]|nr:MAG: fatty acid hydroxylase family protein [Candidatus Scalindua sp.]NOG83453.1 sterol desaturase family protein [Planctomycetota bacterium]RZV72931.1 MAG: fatty acid hydroxylase family protein [Candidatus Scalindua sp. SCAELEC01]TDE64772.1 MAG: fatty acid hydroxylase family protein [Candidatus Scalindua sp. AMX11]
MEKYIEIFLSAFTGYWHNLRTEILFSSNYAPWYKSYFYWLIGLSIIVWVMELAAPWRRGQAVLRKDFWLDGFYLFFNSFLFPLIGYYALSSTGVELFNDLIGIFGMSDIPSIQISQFPKWVQLITMFFLADFVHWNIHRLLHRSSLLWEFHKVHHSVKILGFASHLRFHWMETVIYKSLQYIPLSLIGFGVKDFFTIHLIALLIGHLNHANLKITYGPFKYLLNNPVMHIWHHAKKLPNRYGVNFGISLSLWDYLFRTAYLPKSGRDIELGFHHDDLFPQTFFGQILYPFNKRSHVPERQKK